MSHATQENLNLFWFLPTHGDGRYLAPPKAAEQSIYPIYSRLRWRQIIWATTVY